MKNTPEERLKELAQENAELKRINERMAYRNRMQRNEIRKLNRAIIERNYVNHMWAAEVAKARGNDAAG